MIPIGVFTLIDAGTASSSPFQRTTKIVHDHAGIVFTIRWNMRSRCDGKRDHERPEYAGRRTACLPGTVGEYQAAKRRLIICLYRQGPSYMGICKLCDQERDLVDSHIIPLAFHRHLQMDSARPPVILGTATNSFPQRSPGGIYDEGLLCHDCEIRFGPWDQYGAECLIQRFGQDAQKRHARDGGELLIYQIDNWDEARLRMFALSLLWRAAVTTRPFFKRVTLGPHENRLKDRILAGEPGSPNDFSVFLGHWQIRPEHAGMELTQISPYAWRLEGINMAKIFLGGFVFYIKCDKRPFNKPFPDIILAPSRPVFAVPRQLEGSQDLDALKPAILRYAEYLRR